MSAVKSAILTHLQGASTITALVGQRIYPDIAPEKAVYPFLVVIAQRPPAGVRVFQAVGFEESVYLVKAIDRSNSPAQALAINQAVRASLEDASLTITGYTTRSVEWVGDVDYAEMLSSILYQHQGGFYFVMAEGS